MAVNTFMHDRNIYKTAPDHISLAIKYPEFRKIAKLRLDGSVYIDWQNENALPTLTKCLLKQDFGLDVDFPEGSLIPTVPLRLNYVLWIEDILKAATAGQEVVTAHGFDIGCGASCIYSLLCAKKNGWKMTAIESYPNNEIAAKQNVGKNDLSDLIRVVPQKPEFIFKDVIDLDGSEIYDFCVCNPPFYDKNEPRRMENRTGRRSKPKNCATGNENEMFFPGGELAFIKCIVKESLLFKDKIKIFTSMIGHKKTIFELREELISRNIWNHHLTEFCQGNTTRWGIAWTFYDNICLHLLPPPRNTIYQMFKCRIYDKSFDDAKTILMHELKTNKIFTKKIIDLEENQIFKVYAERLGKVSSTQNHPQKRKRLSSSDMEDLQDDHEATEATRKIPASLASIIEIKGEHGQVHLKLENVNGKSTVASVQNLFQNLRNALKHKRRSTFSCMMEK